MRATRADRSTRFFGRHRQAPISLSSEWLLLQNPPSLLPITSRFEHERTGCLPPYSCSKPRISASNKCWPDAKRAIASVVSCDTDFLTPHRCHALLPNHIVGLSLVGHWLFCSRRLQRRGFGELAWRNSPSESGVECTRIASRRTGVFRGLPPGRELP